MDRRIDLEGCLNFRDLGGYPTDEGRRVRWRLVFRSDALHHLTPTAATRLHGELGITTVIDLRSSAELAGDGRGALASVPVRFVHLPLFDGAVARASGWTAAETLADRYSLLAEFARGPIAEVVGRIADADGPVVYHCAAGKDRTGVVSAVLLGLLGVPDDVVVADYVATQEALDAIVERLLANEAYQAMLTALPPDTLHAEAGTMIAFLQGIRARYGSMRAYARAAGLDDRTIERLRTRLLEA
jgi:protein-tyrosine phosphatase